MKNTAARCIWSFLITLGSFSVWTLCAAALNKFNVNQQTIAIAATSLAALVQLAAWLLIWRKHIAFSATETLKISIGFSLIVCFASYVAASSNLHYSLIIPPLLPIWLSWSFAPSKKLQLSYATDRFDPGRRLLFTRNTAKTIATMCSLNIYAIAAWLINESLDMRDLAILQMAFICVAISNALYVITIWHNIRWTARRTLLITLCFAALMPLWLFSSDMTDYLLGGDDKLLILPYILLFNMALMLILKRTKSEVRDIYYDRKLLGTFNSTIYCPYCNFNMTGLTKLRCPECGTYYRLDRLIYENAHTRVF